MIVNVQCLYDFKFPQKPVYGICFLETGRGGPWLSSHWPVNCPGFDHTVNDTSNCPDLYHLW